MKRKTKKEKAEAAEQFSKERTPDNKLCKLKINSYTIILVKPENNNEKYAQDYLERMGKVDADIRVRLSANGKRSKKVIEDDFDVE